MGRSRKTMAEFFSDAFTAKELQRFITRHYGEVAKELNWSASLAELSFELGEALRRFGLIDERLFNLLIEARPKRAAEIQALRGPASTPSSEPPTPAPQPGPAGVDQRVEPLGPLLPLSPDNERRYHLFISYAPEDREFVEPLAAALHGRGIRIFYDEWSIALGESLPSAVEEGVRASRNGLVVMTPDTLLKGWAQAQYHALLDQAVTLDRLLIPVLMGNGQVELPAFLRLRRYLDLRGKSAMDLPREVEAIVRALQGRPPGPPSSG